MWCETTFFLMFCKVLSPSSLNHLQQAQKSLCLQVSLHAIFATSFEQSMSLHHSASELEIYSASFHVFGHTNCPPMVEQFISWHQSASESLLLTLRLQVFAHTTFATNVEQSISLHHSASEFGTYSTSLHVLGQICLPIIVEQFIS